MGGRGSGSAGGSGGGGKTETPRVKSDIGIKRDEIRSKVNKAFEKSYLKTVKDENGNNISITIKVTSSGQKHITNDILSKNVISEKNIHKLGNMFAQAKYDKKSGLRHSRKDNKDVFYYFKDKSNNITFNVGRNSFKTKNGNIKFTYVLYAITK